MTLLVATAVEAEAEAVRAGLRAGSITVAAVGVGAATAAAATARLLALAEAAGRPYRAVISAGIGGGFAGRAPVGAIVVATRSVAADLGADSPDGFIPLDTLGFGSTVVTADPKLCAAVPDAIVGDILTINTVTGTAAGAEALAGRYPAALAEAMEGYGVARAAVDAGLPFAELRTISNPIGPRDRAAWRIREALDALTHAASTLSP